MYVLFLPDLEFFKSKGGETSPLTVFHTQLLAIFDVFCEKKNICINYANFHDCKIFGKKYELLWKQTFFSFKALSMQIMMMYLIFHAHVNCM